MKYLTIQQVTCTRPKYGPQLDPLMDALLILEEADEAIADPELAADVGTGWVDVEMLVDADDPAAAMVKALAILRAAIHAIGDTSPGWETSFAVMHVAPADDLLPVSALARPAEFSLG